MSDLVVRGPGAQIDQSSLDLDAPGATIAPKRRSPRKWSGGPVIKMRLTTETEADAERACALVEELLAALNCRLQRPRVGSNPKYADDPKWLAYGDFELPASTRKTTKPRRRKA